VITAAKGWWAVNGCYLSFFFMKKIFFFSLGDKWLVITK